MFWERTMTDASIPKVTITSIEITQHRLAFDPPFHASWDTKPRHHWDATIVRVHTDAGLTGLGSGDLMLGFAGHEHLFVGQDALAIERHSRSGISPARSPASPAGNCSAACRTACAPTPLPARCASPRCSPTRPKPIGRAASER
jgi:hypothetical protein